MTDSPDFPLKEGSYRIENYGFPSERVKRVLDLKGGGDAPGTPIICYPDHGGSNQKWEATKFDGGYNFQALKPPSNVFISSIGPGVPVTGTPLQKTAFKLHNAGGNNRFQITATENKKTYALEAPDSSEETITLSALDATNTRQIWEFHTLN